MLPLNPCSFSFIAIKYRYTQNVNGACKVWFWNSLLLVSRPCCWSNRTSEGRSGWTLFFKLELCFESSDMLMHLYNPFMLRVVQSHIYGVCTIFLAGKSPIIRSYTVHTYGSGQHFHVPTYPHDEVSGTCKAWYRPVFSAETHLNWCTLSASHRRIKTVYRTALKCTDALNLYTQVTGA